MDKNQGGPLLSIVIANYNYGQFLESSIRSVVEQDVFGECELLVVDGGSTDNSIEIVKKYESKIAWWVSEKDRGQSDAFNKGFAHAKGKYLTWLNADDVLVPGALAKVIKAFKRHPETEWFTANTIRFLNDGSVYQIWWGPHWCPMVLQRKNSPIVTFGPSTFFAKALYDRLGPIDETFHLVMDTDLWMRYMSAGVKQRRINCFVWGFRMHELSKTAEFGEHNLTGRALERMKEESARVDAKNRYCSSKLLRLLCLLVRVFDGSFVRKWWWRRSIRNVKDFEGWIS